MKSLKDVEAILISTDFVRSLARVVEKASASLRLKRWQARSSSQISSRMRRARSPSRLAGSRPSLAVLRLSLARRTLRWLSTCAVITAISSIPLNGLR